MYFRKKKFMFYLFLLVVINYFCFYIIKLIFVFELEFENFKLGIFYKKEKE